MAFIIPRLCNTIYIQIVVGRCKYYLTFIIPILNLSILPTPFMEHSVMHS